MAIPRPIAQGIRDREVAIGDDDGETPGDRGEDPHGCFPHSGRACRSLWVCGVSPRRLPRRVGRLPSGKAPRPKRVIDPRGGWCREDLMPKITIQGIMLDETPSPGLIPVFWSNADTAGEFP